MQLRITSDWRYALRLALVSLLCVGTHGDDHVLQRRDTPRRKISVRSPGTGLPRSITIVTDTLLEDPIINSDAETLHPAHSWVIFGSTSEERPLRVELVTPTINDVPHGFAISVIELISDRDDVGNLDYALPTNVRRTITTLTATTRLQNVEIYDPYVGDADDAAKSADDAPFPVLWIAQQRATLLHRSKPVEDFFVIKDSHRFVEDLIGATGAFDISAPEDLIRVWGDRPYTPGTNAWARANAIEWGFLKRIVDSTREPGDLHYYWRNGLPSEDSNIGPKAVPLNHIFYEVRVSQPRLRTAPRQPSVLYVSELYLLERDGVRLYAAQRIKGPLAGFLRRSGQAILRHGPSIVRLSRDPHLTSDALSPSVMGALPLLLESDPTLKRPVTPVSPISTTSDSPETKRA